MKAANPITDDYSGIRACVSVNTAVAARVGTHRISYQPGRDRKVLQLYVDGKPVELPRRGLELDGHRLTVEDVDGGGTAVRVDYTDHTVLIITPYFWTSYGGVWLLNVSVAHTPANQGVMGRIPPGSWLPALPNGSTVGPMPGILHDRWVTLYRTFADAWRVTNSTSLFVYDSTTSTTTFTDRDWPSEGLPCKLLPQFEIPGAAVLQGMPIERAEQVCRRITHEGLHMDCVFDVATTGDEVFALGARLAQDIRERGSAVSIAADKPRSKPGQTVVLTAIVTNLYAGAPRPRGSVTFYVDDVATGPPVDIDDRGRASTTIRDLQPGDHRFRAVYDGGMRGCCALGWLAPFRQRPHKSSSSPTVTHVVM